MTNVTALPPLTASRSHLRHPSPVLPPGTVLTWHPPAHFQFCSVRTTGTPAGSASCSPGLRSWRSSGGLLGPEDADRHAGDSQGSHTSLGTESGNTALVCLPYRSVPWTRSKVLPQIPSAARERQPLGKGLKPLRQPGTQLSEEGGS